MKRINKHFLLIILSCSIVLTPLCLASYRGENPQIEKEYQKMLSSIEYQGDGQFKHQVESFLTVEKEQLSNDRKRYSIYSKDLAATESNQEQEHISFIVDGKTGLITSESGGNLTMLERVNNNCINSLLQNAKDNIGKTWKQSFDLSVYEFSFPRNLTFTMTAISVKTDQYGRMIVVRALSEPFNVSVINDEGKIRDVKSRIRSAYLFDNEIKDIYLSMSVFDAAADINSKNEKLRYEVATYKTDSEGTAVNLKGLGKDFESFIRKVGLTSQEFKVEKEINLPQWAQSEGLRAFQVSNICAAVTCEGALNPVTILTMPIAQIVSLQSTNSIASAPNVSPIGAMLAKDVPALGGMKIAVAPAFAGYELFTATNVTAAAGAMAGGLAIAENNNGSDNHNVRSPIVP